MGGVAAVRAGTDRAVTPILALSRLANGTLILGMRAVADAFTLLPYTRVFGLECRYGKQFVHRYPMPVSRRPID